CVVVEVERGLEMRLADESGAVARALAEPCGDARRFSGQRDAVGDHAVGARVLAGQHRRARRCADRVLIVGAAVVDAGGGERVDRGRPRDSAAIASERIVALLVGGDEEDFAPHGCSSRRRFAYRRDVVPCGLYRRASDPARSNRGSDLPAVPTAAGAAFGPALNCVDVIYVRGVRLTPWYASG